MTPYVAETNFSLVMESPDSSLNLTNIVLSVAFELDSVPNVTFVTLFTTDVPIGIIPARPQPFEPLPPAAVFAPGTPMPSYGSVASSQPFNVLVESVNAPGNFTQHPLILPLNSIANLLTAVRLNANSIYCEPLLPTLRSGPTGK